MSRLVFALLMTLMTSTVSAEWTPPANPDPSAILSEARADAIAGRYSDALAKHLWFHRHALTYRPSLYGVRLSFAIGYWLELAKNYPPALEKLMHVKEESASRLRDGSGTSDDFHDAVSINEYLNEDSATIALFMWLDQNRPDVARQSYEMAQPALVRSKQYSLCGKYIDSKTAAKKMLQLYLEHKRMAKNPSFGPDIETFGQKSLSNQASTLVALLVLNNRTDEADAVIMKVLKAWPDHTFRQELAKAREGLVPEPWPTRGD
jgi:hypothetical protein